MRYVKHFLVAVLLLLMARFLVQRLPSDSTIRIFCAYDKLFIEFEEKNSRWGTMFLDNAGKPMSCNKKITVEQYSL